MSRVFDAAPTHYLVSASHHANYDANGDFTVAGWVKRANTTTDYLMVATKTDGATNDFAFYINASNGLLKLGMPGQTHTSSGAVSDTNWHHIAVTRESGGAQINRFYIDGVAAGTSPDLDAAVAYNAFTIRIGSSSSNGYVCCVAYYSATLSAGNIAVLADALDPLAQTPESVGSGCVASWHLLTSSLADSSATGVAQTVNVQANFDAASPFAGVANETGTATMTSVVSALAGTGTFTAAVVGTPAVATVGRAQHSSVAGQVLRGTYQVDAAPLATVVDAGFTPACLMAWDVTDTDKWWIWSEGMPAGTAIAIASGSVAKVTSGGITAADKGWTMGTDTAVQAPSHQYEFLCIR